MTYDAERHEYRDEWGVLVPSVTQVLGAYCRVDPRYYSPGAAERGTKVHDLCAAYCRGEYQYRLSETEEEHYASGFADWNFNSGAKPLEIEQMVDHRLFGHRYAGRFDLIAEIYGRRVMVDIKTGATQPWHVAQLVAYMIACPDVRGALNLYLSPTGYHERWYTGTEMAAGCSTFAAALAAWGGD